MAFSLVVKLIQIIYKTNKIKESQVFNSNVCANGTIEFIIKIKCKKYIRKSDQRSNHSSAEKCCAKNSWNNKNLKII